MVTSIVKRGKASIQLLTITIVLLMLQHLFLRQNINLGAFRYFSNTIYPFSYYNLVIACHLILEAFLIVVVIGSLELNTKPDITGKARNSLNQLHWLWYWNRIR